MLRVDVWHAICCPPRAKRQALNHKKTKKKVSRQPGFFLFRKGRYEIIRTVKRTLNEKLNLKNYA